MRIAVINETAGADRNADILAALEGRGHTVINAGMTKSGAEPELSYVHAGLLAGVLLNLRRVDFVVGGCGTGQGFLNAAMQYPGVFCGYVLGPLDAWLFAQINGGNCISLPLIQGYGWAADVNLRFIFDSLFSVELGGGYPPHRQAFQHKARATLSAVSRVAHRSMGDIIYDLPEAIAGPALAFPGVEDLIDVASIADPSDKAAFTQWYARTHAR